MTVDETGVDETVVDVTGVDKLGINQSVVVSFPSILVGFLRFHPHMRLFSFRKLFCDLYYYT